MSYEPSTLSLEAAIGQKILLAFHGYDRIPNETRTAIRRYRPAGFTLFRAFNIKDPAQVRALTSALQAEAQDAGLPPFLLAVDQEGGQLMAIGAGATQLPGNMALGATASPRLAHRAGEVLGRELAAMGLNIDYAPACDVNLNPANPVIGTRSFGEDPQSVADLSAAMVTGIQSAGVAATAKHFPGHGDVPTDSHHALAQLPHDLERLRRVEFPPFSAAVRAGARLVMSAHLALPAVDLRPDLPATLSPAILQCLLRGELGFDGVIITDAMDMHAIPQGAALGKQAVRAVNAGVDLLLLTDKPEDHRRVYEALLAAAHAEPNRRLFLDRSSMFASAGRVLALKRWISSQALSSQQLILETTGQPLDLSVVGSSAHQAIAAEIAARSITLVRDHARRLPLKSGARLAVILPRPVDLTPADTSSYVAHSLPAVLRSLNIQVDEFLISPDPQPNEIAALLDSLRSAQPAYPDVLIGTLNAFAQPGQAELVRAVLAAGLPTTVVALRLPYDLAAFPEAPTYLCTYSLLEPSMYALARTLTGQAPAPGHLPVSIPGLYPLGHRSSYDI